MKIALIGCGYVGLVTGACLAEIGHNVLCTDKDTDKIALLEQDRIPFYEPHLNTLVSRNRAAGRLAFTTDAVKAIAHGSVIFICVNTPPLENGDADMTAVDNVARVIAQQARTPKLVVEKSTVPVRTGQQLRRALSVYNRDPNAKLSVASNPEFLREGTAVLDFLHPDRIVVGVEDAAAENTLRELYQPLREKHFQCPVHPTCQAGQPIPFVVTNTESAELIKHASNSFLALKISYINAIADLCERVGANVEEVAYAMGLDLRIGPDYLRPGLGFGGFCLPKDIQAFIRLAERAGVDLRLLREAERLNKERVAGFVQKIRDSLWVLRGKSIGVLGLSFKANTDDIRFSQALEVVKELLEEGVEVRAYDPQAMQKASAVLPTVRYCTDAYSTADGADALAVTSDWQEFRQLDWPRIRRLMRRALILDGRNLLEPQAMKKLGFEYHSIGRPRADSQTPAEPEGN